MDKIIYRFIYKEIIISHSFAFNFAFLQMFAGSIAQRTEQTKYF